MYQEADALAIDSHLCRMFAYTSVGIAGTSNLNEAIRNKLLHRRIVGEILFHQILVILGHHGEQLQLRQRVIAFPFEYEIVTSHLGFTVQLKRNTDGVITLRRIDILFISKSLSYRRC